MRYFANTPTDVSKHVISLLIPWCKPEDHNVSVVTLITTEQLILFVYSVVISIKPDEKQWKHMFLSNLQAADNETSEAGKHLSSLHIVEPCAVSRD